MSTKRSVLVTGATGRQGGAVARARSRRYAWSDASQEVFVRPVSAAQRRLKQPRD